MRGKVDAKGPSVVAAKARAMLVGIQPQSVAGNYYPLTKSVTAIGRSKLENDLRFPDKTMSRHHCRIFERDGVYYLVDINSPNYNPSYVNGQVVQNEIL